MPTYSMLDGLRERMTKEAREEGIPDWMKIVGGGALGFGGYNMYKAHQLNKAMQASKAAQASKWLQGLGGKSKIMLLLALLGAGAFGASKALGGGDDRMEDNSRIPPELDRVVHGLTPSDRRIPPELDRIVRGLTAGQDNPLRSGRVDLQPALNPIGANLEAASWLANNSVGRLPGILGWPGQITGSALGGARDLTNATWNALF